ncbi:MAG: TIGR02266 family protein [Myxococcota bacterium]|nr:TIGR02266 family protein [Myxococcota bacterium]
MDSPGTPLARLERARRVRVNVNVGLHTETNFFVGTSLNLSEGGLFVATATAVPVGTEVELQFTLPCGSQVALHGVVRWRRTPDDRRPMLTAGLGIQFVEISPEILAAVRSFVGQREPLVHGEE